MVLVDHPQRIADDGEGLQSQEVHLDHAGVLHHLAVVLGHQHGRVLGGAHGQDLLQVLGGDDDAGRMDAHAAHAALELLGLAQHVGGEFAALEDFAQLLHVGQVIGAQALFLLQALLALQGRPQNAAQLDAGLLGHQLAESVGLVERQVEHACHIADAQFGGHAAVGDDLRHLVLAVLVNHVVDYALAPFVVEVGVDIGHALAVRVQEALEQQVVLDGVDVGDADAIGHRAARRAPTPGADQHAHVPPRVDEVLHDEEVAREAHRLDGEELEVEALLDLRVEAVDAPRKPALR